MSRFSILADRKFRILKCGIVRCLARDGRGVGVGVGVHGNLRTRFARLPISVLGPPSLPEFVHGDDLAFVVGSGGENIRGRL